MVQLKNIAGWLALFVTCCGSTAQAAIVGFNYTGSQQQFIVPTDVYTVKISAWGAQGQANVGGVVGGLGGFAAGDLVVNPGDILYIYVGGGGQTSTTGGWNGGGNAGAGFLTAQGSGGGGASDVRRNGNSLLDRAIVAGGGGGAGGNRIVSNGRGTGGGGGGGWYGGGGGAGWPFASTIVPTGGTQTSGGSGGDSSWTGVPGNDGTAGIFGFGGQGGNEQFSLQAGGGIALPGGVGGGLIGGSGQYSVEWTGQSGAGGSSYIGLLSNAVTIAGVQSGNGFVELEFAPISAPVPEPTTLISWTLLTGLAAGIRLYKRRTVVAR